MDKELQEVLGKIEDEYDVLEEWDRPALLNRLMSAIEPD